MSDEKKKALAKYLKIEVSDVDVDRHGTYEAEGSEYLVLTDSEADEKCKEEIENSLWAFNASFLLAHMPKGMSEKAIKAIQSELYEDANETFKNMIVDFDHFLDDAMKADGRGHFLSQYDGEENEAGKFFVYQTN